MYCIYRVLCSNTLSPQVFENLFLWLDNARSVTSSDPQQRELLARFDFTEIEIELVQLKARLLKLYVPLPSLFYY